MYSCYLYNFALTEVQTVFKSKNNYKFVLNIPMMRIYFYLFTIIVTQYLFIQNTKIYTRINICPFVCCLLILSSMTIHFTELTCLFANGIANCNFVFYLNSSWKNLYLFYKMYITLGKHVNDLCKFSTNKWIHN